jgi:hypothetical protein
MTGGVRLRIRTQLDTPTKPRRGIFVKRLALLLLLFTFTCTSSASADWRWAPPQFKKEKVTYKYTSLKELRKSYLKEKRHFKRRAARYDKRRRAEWKHWTKLFIPACTWYGESGTGPEYARYRYTLPNSSGSGAYGKFQMMSGTYHNRAKYHDWSALDQEIAARREYWANGTAPLAAC